MEFVMIALLGIVIALLLMIAWQLAKRGTASVQLEKKDKEDIIGAFSANIGTISNLLQRSAENSSKEIRGNLDHMSEKVNDNRKINEERLQAMEKKLESSLELMRQTLERNIQTMQESNAKKLE